MSIEGIQNAEIVTGAEPNDFANEVAALIDSAQKRGFDLDVAACIVVGVAADYARSAYGDGYLDALSSVVKYRAGKPLPRAIHRQRASDMTPAQRKMARHALGLVDGRRRSYRNRYVAGLGTTHEDEWNDLCRRGLAERGQDGIAVVGFCLTEAGALEAIDPGEILDPEDFPASVVTSTQRGGDK